MSRVLGPVEYVVVVFEGNHFKGEIVPALSDLLDSGTIRILDLAVVSKGQDGHFRTLEVNELSSDVAAALAKLNGGELTGLLCEDDLNQVAEAMDRNTTAAAMLFEHVWATEFAQAVRRAKGELVANVRVPHDVVETARESLLEAAASA